MSAGECDVMRYEVEVKDLAMFEQIVLLLYEQTHDDAKIILLSGEMGAGKTEFARIWLRQSGVKDRIKSPSFSIIETYEGTDSGTIHHMDLYRMSSPYELYEIGVEDYITDSCLVEWPERGWPDEIPYDIFIRIRHEGQMRLISIDSRHTIDLSGFKSQNI